MTLRPETTQRIRRLHLKAELESEVYNILSDALDLQNDDSAKYIARIERELEDAKRPSARETLEANQAAVKK